MAATYEPYADPMVVDANDPTSARIKIRQGSAFTREYDSTSLNNSNIDLTGLTGTDISVRLADSRGSSGTNKATLSIGSGVTITNATTGGFKWELTSAQTDAFAQANPNVAREVWVFDIDILVSGVVRRAVTGEVEVEFKAP